MKTIRARRLEEWARAKLAYYAPTPCLDCRTDVAPTTTPASTRDWQWFMVHNEVWAAAGMTPNGGCLCLGCLETRLGRPLVGADFTEAPVNWPHYDGRDTIPLLRLKLNAALAHLDKAGTP